MQSIPHTSQQHSWDCGIACLCSVVCSRKPSSSPESATAALLTEEVSLAPSDRLWTIDLVLALNRHCISCKFYSSLLGVAASHASLSFYSDLAVDGPRVMSQFEEARTRGISMAETSLPGDYLKRCLQARSAIFIVLVDARLLRCNKCWLAPLLSMLHFSYAGHYILVTDYDAETDSIIYMDPSVSAERCTVTIATFDSARRAEGTDEDVIEIALAPPPTNSMSSSSSSATSSSSSSLASFSSSSSESSSTEARFS